MIIVMGFTSCSPLTLANITPTHIPTEIPTNISAMSPTATISPNFTATQKAVELQETQIVQETQNEILAQETQVAQQATDQAEATKQALEQIENQKYETFINAVSENFIEDQAFISQSPDGDIHLSKQIMINKSLITGFKLPEEVATTAINSARGFMVCNASEQPDSAYKNICRNVQKGYEITSASLILASNKAKAQGPIETVFTDGNQTKDGDFDKISIWLGTHDDINQARNRAMDSGLAVINGFSLKDLKSNKADTNSFMFIANKTLYIFGSSQGTSRERSADFSANWPFAQINSFEPDVNTLYSFNNLFYDTIQATAIRFYPRSIQVKILSAFNNNKLVFDYSPYVLLETGIMDRCCQSGVHWTEGCADLAESIITRKY